ncbi:MAG TPA: CBS domain-containing protein [Deltaproteobacteria bacterium]|nr:CBS domain-containing protein [Deltaproteobacteria bacterium]
MRRNEKITKIMTESPITIQVGQPLSKASALMREHGFHHVPVVDGARLVGILSTTDLLQVSYQHGADPRQIDAVLDHTVSIRELMRDPQEIKDTQTVRDAVEILAEGKFHSLPVTTAEGELAGIVTTTDLLRYLKDQY